MTEILIEVSEVLSTTVNASALIATLEVTAGIGGPMGPAGPMLIPMTIRNNMVVGTGVVPLPIVQDGTLVDVQVAMGTAPTGANLTFDIKRNGVSIVVMTVLAGQLVDNLIVPLSIALLAGDRITIDVTQIGSIIPGAFATIVLVVV